MLLESRLGTKRAFALFISICVFETQPNFSKTTLNVPEYFSWPSIRKLGVFFEVS